MRALLLLFLAASAAASPDVTTKYETVNVADGVIAFIAPEPKSGVVNSNCVAIIGDDGVLVVDTGQMPNLAKRMIADIRKQTDKPVRYIVNTHWHWDHNLANFVYAEAFPGVNIISTPFTRTSLVDFTPPFLNFIENNGPNMLAQMEKLRANAKTETERLDYTDDLEDFEAGFKELKGSRFVAPTQTFDSSTSVFLGKREVRIFFAGRANTAGDAIVYIPDAKVLITGDVVVAPTPYATGSYLTDWIGVLKKLSAMDTAAIVPGHGPVMRDKQYVNTLTSMLESLVAQVNASVQKGMTLEETQKAVDLDAFRKQLAGDDRRRNRAFRDYFLQSAIRNAWKQARGEPTSEAPF